MGVPLVPATLLRAEEHLLAAETAKSLFGFFFDFDKEGFVLNDLYTYFGEEGGYLLIFTVGEKLVFGRLFGEAYVLG